MVIPPHPVARFAVAFAIFNLAACWGFLLVWLMLG